MPDFDEMKKAIDRATRHDDDPVLCDECGHPCHADDAVTDGTIALCGSFRGNGCADRPGRP